MNTPRTTPPASGRLLLTLSLSATAVLAGCATGPDAHPRDPMEPWNRGVYKFNDAVDRAVLKPAAQAYDFVTPTPVQTGVNNFFNNLSDAWSTVNSLMQFKGQEAMNSFWRFTINSTFGLGGLLDIATEAQIPRVKQDFGLTLAHYGVQSGPYVVLPLLGPSTLRDTIARPVDSFGNPVGHLDDVGARNALLGLDVVSTRDKYMEVSDLRDQIALDPYVFTRDAYLQNRDSRVTGADAAGGEGGEDDGYLPPVDGDEGAGYIPPADDGADSAAAAAADSVAVDATEPVAVEATAALPTAGASTELLPVAAAPGSVIRMTVEPLPAGAPVSAQP